MNTKRTEPIRMGEMSREQATKELLENPSEQTWRFWPWMPLRKVVPVTASNTIGRKVAVIHKNASKRGFGFQIKLTNLFTTPRTMEEYVKTPGEIFGSVEDLISSGWLVD